MHVSVGHATFSWTIFGQAISKSKIQAFLILWVYDSQCSGQYCNVCFYLYISDRKHLVCRKQLINVMGEDKHLNNLWMPKHFGRF